MGRNILLLCIFLIFTVIKGKTISRNKLLYVVIDGFRYDYTDDESDENIPGFTKFFENGVRAEYSIPCFPTMSFPSWVTLATGLWPESHGIVGNYFYDPIDEDVFSLSDSSTTGKEKWWKNAEPIWSTATKANLTSGIILFSRCDIAFDGILPKFCQSYRYVKDPNIFQTNAEKALQMFQVGYDFIVLYYENLDKIGHKYGPESDERKKEIRNIDTTMMYIMNKIEKMGMTDEVNIIVTSDHGMTATAPADVTRLQLDDYLPVDAVENIADGGPFSNIKAKPGRIQEVYNKLKTMPGVDVYLHDDIPDSLHFKNNKNIHDIILKANINTFIMKSSSKAQISSWPPDVVVNGAHGYDPSEEKMRAIFFAKGPDFKKNTKIDPIQSVDIYPLLAHLLKVKPRPNNGTLTTIKNSLVSTNDEAGTSTTTTTTTSQLAIILLSLVAVIMIIIIIVLLRKKYYKIYLLEPKISYSGLN